MRLVLNLRPQGIRFGIRLSDSERFSKRVGQSIVGITCFELEDSTYQSLTS